jgi:hypothetical protein
MRTVAIMQPYFLPYIGYFQLIAEADAFIIYDQIKYTKKGWINRNRMLRNGADVMFTLPLAHGADALDVVQRELAADFQPTKLLQQWRGAYAKAPYFDETFAMLQRVMACESRNLFHFLDHAVRAVCAHLNITTPITVSSQLPVDAALRAEQKVLALCNAMGATRYINGTGGMALYDRAQFAQHGITLEFLRPKPLDYAQFGAPFVPWLSIVDVLMFNGRAATEALVHGHYEFL